MLWGIYMARQTFWRCNNDATTIFKGNNFIISDGDTKVLTNKPSMVDVDQFLDALKDTVGVRDLNGALSKDGEIAGMAGDIPAITGLGVKPKNLGGVGFS